MSPNPSPNPLITPAPTPPLHLLLPRQSDAYDLSSLYAALSSIEADYSSFDYSSFLAAYSTSEFDYSSFFEQYSSAYLDYSSLLDSLTATSAEQFGNTVTTRTSRPTSTALSASSGGLSTGAKIGIGVGVAVPLIVLLLVGLGIFLWCAAKRKRKNKTNTIVAPMGQTPAQQPYHPQPHLYPQNQGYQPGYQQSPQQYAVSPIQQPAPPQYVQPQAADPNAAFAGYGKGPEPAHGAVELETEYHFARGGAVEIGDTEAPVEEKKGWRAKLGRKPVPTSN